MFSILLLLIAFLASNTRSATIYGACEECGAQQDFTRVFVTWRGHSLCRLQIPRTPVWSLKPRKRAPLCQCERHHWQYFGDARSADLCGVITHSKVEIAYSLRRLESSYPDEGELTYVITPSIRMPSRRPNPHK